MVVHGRSAAQVAALAKRAWIALALTPVGFVLGTVIGEGLYSLQGYQPGTTDAPMTVKALASVPALIVILLPPLGAAVWGRMAFTSGNARARTPGMAGLIIVVVFAMITLLNIAGLA